MLPLLIAGIVFFFLMVGAVVFLICTLIPPLRRYSLSAALWCGAWGPCTVAWIILAGFALVANALAMHVADSRHYHLPEVPQQLWTGYGLLGVLVTILVATIAAVIHQWLIHRITFALFRLYATLVSAGIGSVFGWTFGFWLETLPVLPFKFVLWLFAMLALCTAFGYFAFRNARWLRGEAPQNFTWVSPEEFQDAPSKVYP